jgi:hypothetical protein
VQVEEPEFFWSEDGWITTSRAQLLASTASLEASLKATCRGANDEGINAVEDTLVFHNECKLQLLASSITLIKNKIKFSLYIRNLRVEQLQRHTVYEEGLPHI